MTLPPIDRKGLRPKQSESLPQKAPRVANSSYESTLASNLTTPIDTKVRYMVGLGRGGGNLVEGDIEV